MTGAGKYRTIVADPPWEVKRASHYRWRAGRASGQRLELPYGTLTIKEIEALPVIEWAAEDAHLYLWTVNRHLRASYRIAEVWGFEPSKPLVWCKAPFNNHVGGTFGGASVEFCLFARKGRLPMLARAGRQWWDWPRSAHSAKPDAFLDIVESVSPGPYLEMFARRARFGWDYWGNESLGTAEMPETVA